LKHWVLPILDERFRSQGKRKTNSLQT